MARKQTKVVVCTATAFVVVLFLRSQNQKTFENDLSPQGLSRRLGTTYSPVFDPIVVKSEKSEDDGRYYDNKGRLNTAMRLMVLFPMVDMSPRDGFMDRNELQSWNTQQAIDRLNYRARRELRFRDKDGDRCISFSEYLPHFTHEEIERNETGHGEAGWWMIQFRNADVDRNGTLNLYEFRDFLDPEDSKNQNIRRWLLTEKIRQADANNDHKLSLLEFEGGIYPTYKTYLEYEMNGKSVPSLLDTFSKLDINKDKFLEVEELRPIFEYLCPGELSYAKYYTTYLIREADDNKDGKLTLEEILRHEILFYDTIFANEKDDDYLYHDEL
ncbi:unnamed protein product [Cuscuta epithymum]|uniref:EF-hand domain-containing protein n=1 Tax=Cuscuta epithymum TaxID=186058 RepID=A0AAV0DYS2_9ASTE|nr:unnamed protein product [Cuscuta epithymum]CAH9146050.1 unnamed protein product [Cuscuta epithymum]